MQTITKTGWYINKRRKWYCYPKLDVCLVSSEPKDTNKPNIRRRKDLLLAGSKENIRDLFQNSVSRNNKTGEVLNCKYVHIHEGA